MLVVQWWRSFACPVLKPKANDTMIGMVVSSGSHNSIHGRMSARGHKHRISVLLSPAFMSEMAPIPTEFCAPQRKSLSAINRHNQQLFDDLGGTQQNRWGYGKAQ